MKESQSIIKRIEAHAQSFPDDIALIACNEKLTFKELNHRANLVAKYLHQNFNLGSKIAVCSKRDSYLSLSMLAIFKAGMIYVPLDPEHPSKRLTQLIVDTDVQAVLVHEQLEQKLLEDLKHLSKTKEIIEIQKKFQQLENNFSKNFLNDQCENLELDLEELTAYIMYTSGSTGKPKGVEIQHKTLRARFEFSPYYKLTSRQDCVAGITAVSWNPSVYELFYSLASGATLVLIEMEEIRDGKLLKESLEKNKIGYMRAVPSLWQNLIQVGWQGSSDFIAVSHGDKLSATLAVDLKKRVKAVYNTYGSTEATVFCMVEITKENRRVIPITESLQNANIDHYFKILDENLNPVELGQTGEIHMANEVVAKGYYGDEELTNQKFIMAKDGKTRLYKMGDLARVLENNQIEFLGRADNQVKIRGQRIELGEVERSLSLFEHIDICVVSTAKDSYENTILVGYYIAKQSFEEKELREYLNLHLPVVMIPSYLIELQEFPLNANGKIDRKKLPLPAFKEKVQFDTTFKNNEVNFENKEEVILKIFSEILAVDNIKAHENFFEIGGHSLLATLVCTRIESLFHIEISLRDFYERPNARDLAEFLKHLSANIDQRSLIKQEDREDQLLSFAQERLWFMNKLSEKDYEYNLPVAIDLKGELNKDVLKKALQILVDRHESLRTKYYQDEQGVPKQTIVKNSHVELRESDFSSIKENKKEELKKYIQKLSIISFDLSKTPIFYCELINYEQNRSILFLNLHHISSDGWSQAIVKKEIGMLYRELLSFDSKEEVTELPPLEIQYLDYALWNRVYLDDKRLDTQLSYWKKQLRDLEPLHMPLDYPRPKILTNEGARLQKIISKQQIEKIKAFCLKENISLYMFLLTCFKITLAKYTGQNDIAVGSPIAGRKKEETENLIGFFVNTIVMRSHIDDEMTVIDLIKKVKKLALEAYENQDLPFEKLVMEINPQRDLSRYPLTQTVFALQNTPFDEYNFGKLDASDFPFKSQTTRFDLELHAWERDEGLKCHLFYNTNLFQAWRMEQFFRHFEYIIEIALNSLQLKIQDLSILMTEDVKLLNGFNEQMLAFTETTLHSLIEKQVIDRPDHLAIVSQKQKYTFKQLNEKANQLARYLKKTSQSEFEKIVILMPRSAELIIGMLACLKSKHVYVPIDPENPKNRIEFMIENSRAKIVLDNDFFENDFPNEENRDNLELEIDSDDLAYMIYTSGSTGRPNGVEVSHLGVVNLSHVFNRHFQFTKEDRFSFYSSPSFDASGHEIWSPLTQGCTLYIAPDAIRLVLCDFLAWIKENNITVAPFPTVLMEHLYKLEIPKCLRLIFTGGDALRTYPPHGFPLVANLYGPTENSIVTSIGFIKAKEKNDPHQPTIGQMIFNQQGFVVDKNISPVACGVEGELVVGGIGLAKGYLENKELNQKKFINQEVLGENCRLYRTGDKVRLLPDGRMEFIGRVDFQVSLRGYRIETQEITSLLLEDSRIKDAYTILREDVLDDKRIVSYLVANDVENTDLNEDHVDTWQTLYDKEYKSQDQIDDFNIVGWNSSFTGEAISEKEMKEWADNTVERISHLNCEKILEIGCGSGLLMFPLSKSFKSYLGIDLSKSTIENLNNVLKKYPNVEEKVELAVSAAHELKKLEIKKKFNTIIINSVIQYFPSSDYLTNVISQMIDHIDGEGQIFLGDIRNYHLMKEFHLVIEYHQSKNKISREFLANVDYRCSMDKELLLGLDYFYSLKDQFEQVSDIEIMPKYGEFETEMNMFRYDVTLFINKKNKKYNEYVMLESTHVENEDALIQKIQEDEATHFVIQNIYDHRNAWTIELLDHLKTHANDLVAAIEMNQLQSLKRLDLTGFNEKLSQHNLYLTIKQNEKTVELLISKNKEDRNRVWTEENLVYKRENFSNDPLLIGREVQLKPLIELYLKERLPEYMVPSHLVFLDQLPLTTNGKVDRHKLPPPNYNEGINRENFVAASTEIEKKLERIFAKNLNLDEVGIHDNFFELGGHSLLAVQLISQIEDEFNIDLPLRKIFEHSAISQLAQYIEENSGRVSSLILKDEEDSAVDKIPLTAMDVNFLFGRILVESNSSVWYQVMQVESKLLNIEKLKEALIYVLNKHPLARGSINSLEALGERAYWVIPPKVSEVDLEIREIEECDVAEIAQSYSKKATSLEEAPACRFTLLQVPKAQKSFLLIRYNHAGMDASGIQCLLNSLMSYYLDVEDPVVRVTPFSSAELLDYYQHPKQEMIQNNEMAHLKGLMPEFLVGKKSLKTSILKPQEIFPKQIHGLGGLKRSHPNSQSCEATFIDFDHDQTKFLYDQAKARKTTIDRVFILGLLKAAQAWNEKHHVKGRIEAYWAVNLRPPKAFDSIVGNQFGWSRVRLPQVADEVIWMQEVLNPKSDFLIKGALDWMIAVENLGKWPLPKWMYKLLVILGASAAPSMYISNALTVSVNQKEHNQLFEKFGVESTKHYSQFGSSNRPVVVLSVHQGNIRIKMTYQKCHFNQQGADQFLTFCKQFVLKIFS